MRIVSSSGGALLTLGFCRWTTERIDVCSLISLFEWRKTGQASVLVSGVL